MLQFIRTWIYKLPVSAAVQEALLEGLRLAFVTAISALVTYLLSRVQEFPYPEVWTFVLAFVLREVDKWKHEAEKETLKRGAYNGGLLGF